MEGNLLVIEAGNSYQPIPIYEESASIPKVTKRIITKRADISAEVDSIDKATEKLVVLIEKHGGYIVNSNTHEERLKEALKLTTREYA